MGMAPVAHVLFNKFMTFNPKNPNWVNRDRFVLSYVSIFMLSAIHWRERYQWHSFREGCPPWRGWSMPETFFRGVEGC
jgi:hypothetical protein